MRLIKLIGQKTLSIRVVPAKTGKNAFFLNLKVLSELFQPVRRYVSENWFPWKKLGVRKTNFPVKRLVFVTYIFARADVMQAASLHLKAYLLCMYGSVSTDQK